MPVRHPSGAAQLSAGKVKLKLRKGVEMLVWNQIIKFEYAIVVNKGERRVINERHGISVPAWHRGHG